MKQDTRRFLHRFAALLLAVVLTVGSLPAALATSAGHFTDVPASNWAFSYVERAYADGVITGTGGDPSRRTGQFSPGAEVTYGQFYTILARAFYPEELAGAGQAGDAWYTPALRVALNHELEYFGWEWLLKLAESPLDRYDAAYIIIALMDDKGAALPSEQERSAAAAKIGDWNAVIARDEAWGYYVSATYAAGIITGVDSSGTFAGDATIRRDSAATIYTRLADKLGVSQTGAQTGVREEYQIVFRNGWNLITEPGFQAEMEEIFYESYPRLWARWGEENVPRTVAVDVDTETDDAVMRTHYTWNKAGYWVPHIIVSAQMQEEYAPTYATTHELTHVVQANYTSEYANQCSWWDECMADYGDFRYYNWADADNLEAGDCYRVDDREVRDWHFEEYGGSWFFAYMDSRYPTTPQGYGLIDSIHYAIIAGTILDDDPNDPTFNAVVKRITGYSTIEQLYQKFQQELDAGTWTFNGFAGYADNYITENIPGVPNPTYPTLADANLCNDGHTYGASGQASDRTAGDCLLDGDRSTRWEAAPGDVTKDLSDGVQHSICISLDKPVTVDTYTLYHAGSQGNSQQNTVAWKLWYAESYDADWKVLDEVDGNTQDVTTRTVKPVTVQYLWLDILNASGTGDGTVRLYELELYNKGSAS